MNKKIIVLLLLFTFTLVGCDKIKEKIKQTIDDPPIKESIPLFEFDKYKDFILDNVESLSITKYTEGTKKYAFTFMPVVSSIIGIVFVLILLGFCVDVAVRAIKLAILRLLAPIPIVRQKHC